MSSDPVRIVDKNGVDIDVSNPLPTTGGGGGAGLTTVVQPTHDNLNGNMNLQVGDVDVGAGNPVPSSDPAISLVSTLNSSTTPLSGGATFPGAAEEVADYSTMTVFIDTDQDGTLSMQLSSDGTNWDRVKTVDIDQSIGTGSVHSLMTVSQYARVVFTNGSIAQGHLRLQTIYHKNRSAFLTSSPNQVLSRINDVQLNRVVNEVEIDVSRGAYADQFAVHKFGLNESSPASQRDIWVYGSSLVGNIDYPWPSSADTLNVVSSSANDDATPTTNTGAQSIILEGLDANFSIISEEISLNGVSAVTTSLSFIRVNRAYISNVGTYTGSNEGNITISHTTSGDVLAYISIGAGQTGLSMYSVPAGFTAYLVHAHGSVAAGSNKDATLRMFRRLNADNVVQPFVGGGVRQMHVWENLQGATELDFKSSPGVLGPADLWWTAEGSSTTSVSVVYDLRVIFGAPLSNPQ